MLKKIGKKALSLLLVFVLIATTFFVFDPSILVPKSKAVVDVKKLVNTVEPTVKFYVPETIYLNPVIGTGSQPYSFQYFIDCDENGTLKSSSTQTTGTVYFTCAAACSSISISWENTTVTASTNTSTNQILKQTVTGGKTSVKNGRVKVTATYVVNGKTYYAYAYTYMYYPELDLLTGVASSYVYTATGNEPKLAAFSFITGVHYVGNTTTYNDTERGVSNYYDQYNITSSKGAYGLSPLIPGWASVWSGSDLVTGSAGALFKTANGDAYINDRDVVYGEKTSSTSKIESGNGGVYFHNRERDGDTSKTYGGVSNAWGTLYVDTSRVTNFNQIPNLRGGFICHYYQRCGKRGELEYFHSTDDSITILNNIDFRNGDGKGYGMSSSNRLSGTPAEKNYTIRADFKYRMDAAIGSSSTVTMNQDFGLKVHTVNKAALRSAYRTAIENGWQSATASNNGWSSSVQSQWTTAYNNFATALDQAGTVLGRPYATASEISSALSTLNSRVSSCNSIIDANFTGGENSAVLPQVYFYVPETIYLNPSDNQTFQYFYGVETNGTPSKNISTSTASSGARVYFAGKNCSPSSVKITVACSTNNETNWNYAYSSYISSITYGGTSFTGSNAYSTGKSYTSFPVNIQCTAGKMNSAVTSSGYRFLRWTAEYVVGGITYKTYAYTIVYSPYDKPAAAAVRVYNSRGVECDLQQVAWVSGLTGGNTNGNRTINATTFNPIKGVLTLPTNTENNGGYGSESYLSGSSGTAYYENRDSSDVDQGAQAVAPAGQLVLDSTRFSNLQYVPNFKIGHLISYVNEGSSSVSKRRFGYYLSDASALSFTSPSGYGESDNKVYNENRGAYIKSYITYQDYDGAIGRNLCYPRLVYNGVWDKSVTSTSTVSIKAASRFGIRKKSNDKTSNSNASCVVPVSVTVVNKGTLRSRYQETVSLSKQQDWYAAGYDNYQNSILTMAINLGHPARTNTSSTANTKDLVTKTGTTTAVHLRAGSSADYNGNVGSAIIGTTTESKGYTYGDRVYGYYNDIPGFTKSSYSVKDGNTTRTSGVPQDSSYNNYYYITNAKNSTIDWKFYYTPNTYNIKYDPNGGTYNGTTGLTSSSVLFQSKYTVGLINGSTPANPTRPGCTFMGWKCSADGLVYNVGDKINWEFLEDVTFTAQWEYNNFTLLYNENHDKLASNMFDPLFEENLSFDTTAVLTSTNASGETVTTNKACNLAITNMGNGTLKFNGTLASDKVVGFVPLKVKEGETYVFSSQYISGSVDKGCIVMDFVGADQSTNVSPRTNFDFRHGSTAKDVATKEITITADLAKQITGIRFWIWSDSNGTSYATYNNLIVRPRIELKSGSTTVPTSSTEYNNIFAENIQYNTYVKELPVPTREGYTFDGWFTKAEGGTQVKVGDRLLCSDWNLDNSAQTLYAHWTINKYKLMYDNELNFDNMNCTTDSIGNSIVTVNKKDNTLTMDGRNVDWSTYTKLYTRDTSPGYGIDGSQMTLIKGHTYEVSFNVQNIGSNSTSGFVLYSWSNSDGTFKTYTGDSSSANGVTVAAGASGTHTELITVPDAVTTSTAILKLRFQISGSNSAKTAATFSDICVRDVTDPMNYRASDGVSTTVSKKFDTLNFNATQNPLATATRRGYTFNGWYQSQNTSNGNGYGTQFTTSTAMPSRDVQLFARWALNEYTVTINLNADNDDKATIGSFNYSRASNNTNGDITTYSATSSQQTSTGTISAISVAYGTSFTLPIPSRTGYTFTGWTASATPEYASLTNNGNTSASSYRVGAGAVTLTANWSKNSYPVKAYAYGDVYSSATFAQGRGGTVQIASDAAGIAVSKNITYRATTTLKATAASGYAFVGWYTDSALTNLYSTNPSITSETVLTAGRTYYAKFKVQSYTITVNPDNATTGTTLSGWYSAAGTKAANQTVKTSTNITMVFGSTLTMTAPSKTGYTFAGWEKTSGLGTLTSSTTGTSSFFCANGNATIKANWTINQYSITVNAKSNKYNNVTTYTQDSVGGTVQINVTPASTSAKLDYNTKYSITATAKAGYRFDGWYTDSDLKNKVGADETYSTNLGASNISYYAKFSVMTYTVTIDPDNPTTGAKISGWYDYDSNKTTPAAEQQITKLTSVTMTYGSTVTMTAPAKTGYTFAGWEKTSGSGTLSSSTTGNSTFTCGLGSATVKAKWTLNTFTIKFDGNTSTGGTMNPQTFTYNVSQKLTANVYEKQYTVTFDGNGGTVNGSSSATDTAKWDFSGWNSASDGTGGYSYADQKEVTNPCGMVNMDDSRTLYAQWSGGNLTLKTAVRSGYTFLGWALTDNAEIPTYTVNQSVNFKKNTTLFAVWVETATSDERVKTVDVVSGITITSNDLSVEPIIKSQKKYTFLNNDEYTKACEAYETALKNFNASKTIENAKLLVEKVKEVKTYQTEDFKYDAPIKVFIRQFEIKYAAGVTGAVKSGTYNLDTDLNLNHYTKEVLSENEDSILKQVKKAEAITNISRQSVINEAVKNIAKNFATKTKVTTTPKYKVYENTDEIKKQLSSSPDIKGVNYVRTDDGNSVYYCYTSNLNPTVYLEVEDTATSAGRLCYPTRSEVSTSISDQPTLKKLTESDGVTARSTIGTKKVDNSTYAAYLNEGLGSKYVGDVNGNTFTGINYYQQKSTITLNPIFTGKDNASVQYVITSTDDSYNSASTTLGGNYAKVATLSAGLDKNEDFTASTKQSITIVIDYHPGDGLNVTGDQVQQDTYLKQFHLFRDSGGARNWEFPRPQAFTNPSNGKAYDTYLVDDGTYGQEDYGSFTFTFKLGSSIDILGNTKTANGETGYIPTLNTTDANEIAKAIANGTISFGDLKKCSFTSAEGKPYYKYTDDGEIVKGTNGKAKNYPGITGYGFIAWSKANGWSFNYYPASGAYTYVHLVDRWGNTVDKVIYVGLQDAKDVSTSGKAGSYTILEDGGSGINTLSLNGTFEILTDSKSSFENNVYKTTGNVIRIKTAEANKSYTLSMKDKATNASSATVTSDENGVITFTVDDTAYKNGVYTFKFNDYEINLYSSKYILEIYDGTAEEGEYADITVVTTGEVGKTRLTDSDGNTVTLSQCVTNEDGTKTWTMSKSKPAGEYKYTVSVKVGHTWYDESSEGKLTFTERVLDSGLIRSAEYDAETGLYKITIEGRATKIQFITEDGMTRTYTRYADAVKSKKSYDEEGNEVPDIGRTLDHEVWLVEARLYSGQKYTVAGKFEAGWNREGTASLTAH